VGLGGLGGLGLERGGDVPGEQLLDTAQRNGPALRLRPNEAATLQSLGKQAKPIAIEPQKFYLVAAASTKNKDVSREWLLVEHRLHLRAQPVEAAAHIRHASSKPGPRARAEFDHLRKLSRIKCNIVASAPLSTLIVARPGNSM